MLSGVIQTDRNGPEACSDELLSQLARAEHGSLPKPILKTPWVTCYARNQPTVDLWVLTDEKGRTIVVCGFLAVSGDARPALQQQLARDAESSLSDLPGIWNALIHDPHEKRTSLASDRLGVAWLYVARSGTRLIFSSRFDVCARAAPARTLNMDASLATLELGYPPANQTCLEQVQLLPPGAVCKIDEAGYQAPEREAIRYGSEFAGLEIEEKMEALDRAYDQALAAWCPEPDKRYLLSLSGGYDSRAVLGAMLRKNRRVHCASFGRIRTPDCVKARRLAESLGLEHSVFRIPDPSWDDLSRTFSTSGGIGGTPFVQGWSEPWLKFVQSRNDNLVIGFLGGVLTGSQAGRSKEQAWLEYWDQWSFDGGFVDSPLMREEARAEIRPAIHRETMRLPNAQVAFEYQNILHVNLYTRQRRCIGIQPYVIGRYVRPITFLYHPAVLSFWSNVAFEDVTKAIAVSGPLPKPFSANFRSARQAAVFKETRRGRDQRLGRSFAGIGQEVPQVGLLRPDGSVVQVPSPCDPADRSALGFREQRVLWRSLAGGAEGVSEIAPVDDHAFVSPRGIAHPAGGRAGGAA